MALTFRFLKKNRKASFRRLTATLAGLALCAAALVAQERGPAATPVAQIKAAINALGDLDYGARAKAGRLIRRSAAPQAVPVLLETIREHADGYIRFRSLVLLTGFNDPRTAEQMEEMLSSPNDRLREAAFAYFERHPQPALIPKLLAAFDQEQGDFVRPSLMRALAALDADPAVQKALLTDVTRGVDFFRSAVIEALGDYKRAWAVPPLIEVAKLEGPLQDDAVLALGKIGDKQALGLFAELQRKGARTLQPTVAAAICLLGVNCGSHISYLEKVLRFADDNPGYQELVRAAAAGLAALGVAGNLEALTILLDQGIPSMDPIRAPLTLAVGQIAIRNTPLMLKTLEQRTDQRDAIGLLAEAFDMLEEDLEEEQFFVTVRRGYWAAPDKSPARQLAEQLITRLDF